MNDSKPWYQSKTIIGVFVTVLSMVLGRFGGEVDQVALINILSVIGELVGSGLAVYGRVKANSPIVMRKG